MNSRGPKGKYCFREVIALERACGINDFLIFLKDGTPLLNFMWPCGLKSYSQETFRFHNQWKWLFYFSLFCTSSIHPGWDQRNFITLERLLAYGSPPYRNSIVYSSMLIQDFDYA